MKRNILIVGTIAFDILFPIQGDMRKEIPLKRGKIRSVNMTFLARKSQYYYGGTAGNMAYGLSLLGKNPIIFSVAGIDFKDNYQQYLEDKGIICKPIIGPKLSESAKAYIISDDLHQQIQVFQANYYGERSDDVSLFETLSKAELGGIKIAIFSALTNTATLNTIREFRRLNKKATVILDIGVNIPRFSKVELEECISLSNIFISNEIELWELNRLHKLSTKDLLSLGIEYVIETKGEKGSSIYSVNKRVDIEGVKPREVIETTGAGDAYRAGLIAGLIEGKDIKESCKIGARLAAKSVEEYGGQGYKIK
ncbi:hypothetical protein JW766_01230 [Candidatus Dojkabacteria bacterium]|nr:hypothetical protein [Candidatus Dojkabacteria bacterium]